MNLNLTGQFWGMPMNATLVQPTSIQIGDWLPSITAIVVVILGGYITYYATFKQESNRRKYELKKDTYFELLSILSEIGSFWYDAGKNYPLPNKSKCSDVYKRLALIIYKLRIIGASDKLIQHVERLAYTDSLADLDETNTFIKNSIIPELKNELFP